MSWDGEAIRASRPEWATVGEVLRGFDGTPSGFAFGRELHEPDSFRQGHWGDGFLGVPQAVGLARDVRLVDGVRAFIDVRRRFPLEARVGVPCPLAWALLAMLVYRPDARVTLHFGNVVAGRELAEVLRQRVSRIALVVDFEQRRAAA